ncbi:ATP12 family protein [Chelatococcus sp. SYSU_G07232]|uniref:ATP12 family protein n=1 Tax=Chelatococcus albus TaxID=3047466 RepID=A0ABT7AD04_9HYPH|nr:ATP12 family protein [Chelatococcus sp. SYSU_G07232]MDJ1157266.1 ATP12 family protein [Chelatococcus sp. SYSU_G07232]
MSDDLTDIFFPSSGERSVDPMKAAQEAMRKPLPRRFYKAATVEARGDAFVLLLDGRAARTPARKPLSLPTRAAAEAVAAEWAAQIDVVDPATMPLTRLVNSAIDGVAADPAAVAADAVKYAGSDLLCYRADAPARLAARQTAVWDPVLAWARERLGSRFVLAAGVMFVEQPPEAIAGIERAVAAFSTPLALAALHAMTTLTGSVLIALAVAHGRLSVEEGWQAAHVDEDVQMEIWGKDAEALARREHRFAEFRAAATLLRLVG